jgi:hypothetical protein
MTSVPLQISVYGRDEKDVLLASMGLRKQHKLEMVCVVTDELPDLQVAFLCFMPGAIE